MSESHSTDQGRSPVRLERGPEGRPPSDAAAHPPAAVRPRRRIGRPFIILGLVVLALLLVIGGYLVYMHGKEATDDAQIAADIVSVGSRVPGQVLRVTVQDNQPVKKGDLLIELDPADLQARVAQAEAELASAGAQEQAAQAQVQIVERGAHGAGVPGTATAQVNAARAAVNRALADAKRAELDWKRAQDLFAQGAMSKAQLDQAQATLDTNQAALEQARAQLTGADAQVSAARANVDIAAARKGVAQASLDAARLQLSYTRIEAPVDGFASKLSVHPGSLVQAGQPLVSVVPSATYIIANFKETQIGDMRPGQRAVVHVDAYGRDFEAKVDSLSGATGATFSLLPPDNASGNFVKVVQRVPVRLAWVNQPADVGLRPGLSVDVTVYVH